MNEKTSNLTQTTNAILYPPTPEEMAMLLAKMPESIAGADLYPYLLESQCGTTDDSQPVEQYDGTLGVTKAFVNARQLPVGQLQWNDDLDKRYDEPGNVANERWCSGTLIADNLFLTAAHCFDNRSRRWRFPLVNGTTQQISPAEAAMNMHINFNFQDDPMGKRREEQEFAIEELVEFGLGGLDFAIVRLAGNPGRTFGKGTITPIDAALGDMLAIIGHPNGQPKRIEAGPASAIDGDLIAYNSIDTMGGNSGSAIWLAPSGRIVGIHIQGGCRSDGSGANSGVRMTRMLAVSPTLRRLRPIPRVVDGLGYKRGGWRVERHPRTVANVSQSGALDVVGFGNAGVYVARNNGNGTFQQAKRVLEAFGEDAGGWRVDSHLRLLADLTGDGATDIVGFGDEGVHVALSNGDGTFQRPRRMLDGFGYLAGSWRLDRHPRFLADLTGDGTMDIVGFSDKGVYVALSNGNGTFQPMVRVVDDFGYRAGGWRMDSHLRLLADLTGDGTADIVGFGSAGVHVAVNRGDGTFHPARKAIEGFSYQNGGWRVDRHPRFLSDLTGDGRADIVGFGNNGVYVALGRGDGTFAPVRRVIDGFGYQKGGWRVDRHPRLLADVTGDGTADIVGLGDRSVYVALSNGDGTFQPTRRILDNFAYLNGGWRVDRHPRLLADVTGNGRADIVGFGDAGVYVWAIQ